MAPPPPFKWRPIKNEGLCGGEVLRSDVTASDRQARDEPKEPNHNHGADRRDRRSTI